MALITAKRLTFAVMGLVTLVTVIVHERYVFDPVNKQMEHFAPFRWWLIPHIAAGVVALALGPLQFDGSLRRRHVRVHRWLGRIYLAAVVIASGLSLKIILTFEEPGARWVMGVMGGAWLFATLAAWIAILNRATDQHRAWMIRSYALTFTFVSTRFLPDVVFRGLDYYNTTSLYWILILTALITPELIDLGSVLVRAARRRGDSAGGPR